MTIRRIAIVAVFSVTLFSLSACGGGGGGDEDVAAAGTWTGSATLSSNTCNIGVPTIVTFLHVVNQNGSAVTLNDGRLSYLGNTVGDNGFSVDAPAAQNQDVGGGVLCDYSERIEYEAIEGDTTSVVLTTSRSCTNNSSCELRYLGTAVRQEVTPAPSTTTTTLVNAPLPRDCTLLLERVFSGDGGCGLNSTGVNVISAGATPSIVLDPFGQNGATSFTPSASDASTAGSVRTDLTINGSTGYTCSMSCSPPLTFRVACFKEGGTRCSEKF